MTRVIDVAATEGYLKFTIPLAGVGFAFAQTRLGETSAIYGVEMLGDWSVPQVAIGLLLVLFFVSSVSGIFAVSAIVGSKNDTAAFKALTPNRRHAKLIAYREKRANRMASAYRWANVHLWGIILGFVVAVIVFLGEALNPTDKPNICQTILMGLKVDFACGGSPKDIFERGAVTP